MDQKLYNEIFSKNLVYYMDKLGKTQSDLSKDLNIHKATISSWCRGSRLPKLEKIDLIADYLNIDDPFILLSKNFREYQSLKDTFQKIKICLYNNKNFLIDKNIFDNENFKIILEAIENVLNLV